MPGSTAGKMPAATVNTYGSGARAGPESCVNTGAHRKSKAPSPLRSRLRLRLRRCKLQLTRPRRSAAKTGAGALQNFNAGVLTHNPQIAPDAAEHNQFTRPFEAKLRCTDTSISFMVLAMAANHSSPAKVAAITSEQRFGVVLKEIDFAVKGFRLTRFQPANARVIVQTDDHALK